VARRFLRIFQLFTLGRTARKALSEGDCKNIRDSGSLHPVATAELRTSLEKFAAFARSLHGDEKSEAQTFLDHFFRAVGHGGVIEAGATFEFRVAKKPGSAQLELIKGEGARAKGGKKFADLLWPERVLIEMKSRGAKLERHYDQAFDYWTHIVPHRPPYVILRNFDEFWIYDFNQQLFDPVDRVSLRELSDRTGGGHGGSGRGGECGSGDTQCIPAALPEVRHRACNPSRAALRLPAKAPEDWRSPRRFARARAQRTGASFWTAPVPWRFSRPRAVHETRSAIGCQRFTL